MVEKDTSSGGHLIAPCVQSSSKHLLTNLPADDGNAEQQIPLCFPLMEAPAGFLYSTQLQFSLKLVRIW